MSDPSTSFSDVRAMLAAAGGGLPFACELSLAPLIRFWERELTAGTALASCLGRAVREEVQRAPALAGVVDDPAILEVHRALVATLMTAVFPPASWEQDHAAAMIPFRLQSFYATPSFERAILGGDGTLRGHINVDAGALGSRRLLSAYGLVLERAYGIHLGIEFPMMFTVPDAATGLDRHFKVLVDTRFVDVEPVGTPPALPPDAAERIRAALPDTALLAALIPPGSFRLRGFSVLRGVDVTDQEVLSSLRRDLIDRESIVSDARFQALQDELRTLFRRPALRLGLAAIDGERVLTLNCASRMAHACIFADSVHGSRADFAGSVYERAAAAGEPLFVHDLADRAGRTPVEEEMVRGGVRSVVAAPLLYQGELIGVLELGSPRPGDLDATLMPKLREVLPLFSVAVKRSLDELNARVQAFIKEKCTAIHPVVEWRFRKAVLDGLERQGPAGATLTEMEPIVFPDVYPLYALADIRGSSTQRDWAIQSDLQAQLRLAREVVQAAHAARPLPVLDLLTHRIDRLAADAELTLRSGDEVGILGFLRQEVEALFDHLAAFGPEVRGRIETYRAAVDPQLGLVYRRRRELDDSVTLVNDTIAAYLDLEEQAAQGMYPHLFERQKTDGVDYTIYAGAALLEDGAFHPLYLKNLRLWQLMVACGVASRAEHLKGRLAVPLEVSGLVLVQQSPLAIRFRFDEKRFDVDGAYNVRYEIIKKRIDKAVVRGSGQRLTQPGRIAIVYSQAAEAAEYRDYVDYLRRIGYLTGETEDLELEELPGAQGLRALRVAVDLASPRLETRRPAADLAGAFGAA